MTTPNDAPRPTSELVKRLRAAAEDNTVSLRHLNVTAEDTLWWEAAASLQALEERNKELEGADAAILSAYRGIMVLRTMCRKAGLKMGRERSEQLLVELDAAFPGLAARSALRAALHPTTKTGET